MYSSPRCSADEQFVVDFIARDPWKMVLVEQGPWDDIEANLYRVQERLYNCVDAVIEGQLAEKYPESQDQPVVVHLSCHNLPEPEIREFFDRFSSLAPELPEYKAALEQAEFVSGISFEISFQASPDAC